MGIFTFHSSWASSAPEALSSPPLMLSHSFWGPERAMTHPVPHSQVSAEWGLASLPPSESPCPGPFAGRYTPELASDKRSRLWVFARVEAATRCVGEIGGCLGNPSLPCDHWELLQGFKGQD